MGRNLVLIQSMDTIVLAMNIGKKQYRIHMDADEAQHVSNRLQAFAKSGHNGVEMVLEEGEYE